MTALFRNVLTASFHGSIVILATLLLRLVLGRAAPKKYLCCLWVLAGLRLLLPLDIQSSLSLQPQAPPEALVRWEAPEPLFQSAEGSSPLPGEAALRVPGTGSAPLSEEAPSQGEAANPAGRTPVTALAPFLWAAVSLAFLSYNLYSYRSLRRKVAGARKIPGGWESDGIDTAFLLRFIQPQIYIPAKTPQEDRPYILAHERTHLDKGDHWVRLLGFLALSLHWFNPLVWLSYALMCKDLEMACDERVVRFLEPNERKEYAAALLNCSSRHVLQAASPLAFGEVNVKNRIRSVLAYRAPSFWAGFLSAMAVIFVTVCLVTNPPQAPEMPEAPGDRTFTVATQPPMEENPDWGLSLLADVISPTSINLYFGVGIDGNSWDETPITKEIPYALEAWKGDGWEVLPWKVASPDYSGSDPSVGSFRTELRIGNCDPGAYRCQTLDWRYLYGALPEGDYRIRVPFTRLGETRPCYAWFHIYANALTGEEAEALARVENALDLLSKDQYHTASISESTDQGALLPSLTIRQFYRHAQVDYWAGEYLHASFPCDASDSRVSTWWESFCPPENGYISFSDPQCHVTGEEICFVSSYVDALGRLHQKTCTYLLNEFGQLTGADLLTRTTDGEGITTQSRRVLSLDYKHASISEQAAAPKDPVEAALESPWGIHFQVEDDTLTASGGDVLLSLDPSHVGVSPYTTDGSYWLEKWTVGVYDNGKWNRLPSQAGDPTWGSRTDSIRNATLCVPTNWTAWYGVLEPGLYRMGKRFYNGEESTIQYAQFQVQPAGLILGPGGEEAMARVNGAIEALCAGNYCIRREEYSVSSLFTDRIETQFYWKWQDICVTDYYDRTTRDYTHSRVVAPDAPDADPAYSQWVRYLFLDSPEASFYFPQGGSVISDREISFLYGLPASASLDRYSLFFDGEGSLRSIEIHRAPRYAGGSESIRVYTLEDRPESEIRAWAEEKRDQASKMGS